MVFEEGFLLGAGISLLKASKKLNAKNLRKGDIGKGIALVQTAIEAPIREIAMRAGQNSDFVLQEVMN